jgi:ribonuclease P protein component
LIGSARAAGDARLGVTVPRRIGSAVRRNRAKRRLRECYRRNKPDVALDVVLVAKREILDVSAAELEREYRRRLAELLRRVAGAGGARASAGD